MNNSGTRCRARSGAPSLWNTVHDRLRRTRDGYSSFTIECIFFIIASPISNRHSSPFPKPLSSHGGNTVKESISVGPKAGAFGLGGLFADRWVTALLAV